MEKKRDGTAEHGGARESVLSPVTLPNRSTKGRPEEEEYERIEMGSGIMS